MIVRLTDVFKWAWLIGAMAFGLRVAYWGGTASWGKVDGGQYYVGQHGKLRPIPAPVYYSLLVHERVLDITLVPVVAALIVSARRRKPHANSASGRSADLPDTSRWL